MSSLRLFIARRSIAPPAPVSDILTPILASFVAVILGAIFFIIFPYSPSLDKDYKNTNYEYYPVGSNFFSVTARSVERTAGNIIYNSSVWTFNRNSGVPYSLEQIFRDHSVLSDLIGQQPTEEILRSSFVVDRINQELIASPGGIEQHIKFSDLEGRLNFEFYGPMFGIDPSASNIDCRVAKCLALTFDDGPGPHTDRLLDILKSSHAQASFFVLGHRAWAFSGQIARAANEGHDVGSHSWIHRNLPRFSYAFVLDDLNGTTNVIQPITGQPVKFLRPPYGNTNSAVYNIAAALNQQIVLWSIDPWDWQNKDANYICDHVASHAHPGGVVLLHDIYDTSIDATQCIIDRLSNDYVFVNLSTLYK